MSIYCTIYVFYKCFFINQSPSTYPYVIFKDLCLLFYISFFIYLPINRCIYVNVSIYKLSTNVNEKPFILSINLKI